MRMSLRVVCVVVVVSSARLFAVSGVGAAFISIGENQLRVYKVTNNHVDTSLAVATGASYFGGLAINTHGTHLAFWRRTRANVDSTATSTDWRTVLANQDDAALVLLGSTTLTQAQVVTATGCTAARVTQLKASIDSIAKLGSPQLWAWDQCRRHAPDIWPFETTYDATKKTWSKWLNKTVPEYRLSVIRIDNPQKMIDLVITGRDLTVWRAPGTIAWPKGDWIYFSTTGEGYRFIYRVNAQTRAVEFATLIDEQWRMVYPGEECCVIGDEFKMSALGNRVLLNSLGIVTSLQELQTSKGKLKFGDWASGGMNGLGGCGQSISASGNVGACQFGAGHNDYTQVALNWQAHTTSTIVTTLPSGRNRWSVDKTDAQLACTVHDPLSTDPDAKIVESVGVAQNTTGQNFAVNSDKWLCLCSGWAPAGRFGTNGMNFILCNPRDSISLNVTRGPRRLDAMFGTVEPQCFTQPTFYFTNEAVFCVKEPLADIIPELQADVAQNYLIPGLDDNTVLPALTMMAATPYAGPTSIAARPTPDVRSAGGRLATVRIGAVGLRVNIEAAGSHAVTLFDVNGTLVARKRGSGSAEVFTWHDGLRRGMYLVRVEAAQRVTTTIASFAR